MSLVYDHSNFKHPEREFRKNQDFMDPYYPNLQQQNQFLINGFARYRSAPTDFSDGYSSGGGDDDYRSFRSPSPEMDSFFAKVMKKEEKEPVSEQIGYVNGSEIAYRDLRSLNSGNSGALMERSFGVMNNASFENSMQAKPVNDINHNGSGLARQHSSPAGFLSNSMMENEIRVFRKSSDVNGEAISSKNGVSSHMKLQYEPPASWSGIMPQISEIVSNFANDSWNKTSFNLFEGTGGTNITFSGVETQNRSSRNKLVHHLSMPTTFSEKETAEKFLHFQGSPVPCKLRAKRGFATHPRSIAERVRRNRISQRMKKLQDLFPEMDKQTNTADMLDMAVAHIKELQKKVKALTDTRAMCSCSGKGKQIKDLRS